MSRQNHKENKDAEIPAMPLKIDAIQTTSNIPDYMAKWELQQALHKKTTYNRSKNIVSNAGQRTKIKYNKA